MYGTGLAEFGFVGRAELALAATGLDEAIAEAYGLPRAKGCVVIAMPYDPRPLPESASLESAGGPPPYARVAPFAAANRYAALVRLLRAVVKAVVSEAAFIGVTSSDFRVFANSRLPEKALAVQAGLGFYGRSSLLVDRAYGPACLLGGILLPFDPLAVEAGLEAKRRADREAASAAALVPGGLCGACQACAEACPTGAIRPRGLEREQCIQHWTTERGPIPARIEAAWGDRLYGCNECVLACPFSSGASGTVDSSQGAETRPGPLVSIPFILGSDDAALTVFFRKTALGMKRFDPSIWRRNALLARRSARK